MNDCIIFALENNLSIKQLELDVSEVDIEKSNAIGALFPSLETTIDVTKRRGLSFDPITNNVVTEPLLTGSGNLTSSITLFDGLRNYNAIARARLNKVSEQYRLEDLKDDIRLNVANAFVQVLSNKESLRALKAQYAATEQEVEITEELVLAGVVPKGDLLEIEATLADQGQQIIEGENMVSISKLNLAQLLRVENPEDFEIKNNLQEIPSNNIMSNSANDIFHKATIHRNDVKFSQLGVELADKNLDIARGARYPTLTGVFEYDTRYSDLFFDIRTGLRFDFFDQLYLNDGIQIRADLDFPIFNRFTINNNIKRAKIEHALAEVAYKRTLMELEADIYRSYVDVSTFSKSYEAALRTLEARRLAHEYSIQRFNTGMMNTFDFIQSKVRVDEAEALLIQTKYEYILRLKILEFYYGYSLG
ncbi:TolC family protein [Maribacter sp. 2210JD10-5]|uniref:TolC family protein n=1 Tax=Maribacter sp. 2210JD10-5 TaxID=3386272 RepID=UPI0039BC2E2E